MKYYIWMAISFMVGGVAGGLVANRLSYGECQKAILKASNEKDQIENEFNDYQISTKRKIKELEKKYREKPDISKLADLAKRYNPDADEPEEKEPYEITFEEFDSEFGLCENETITYYQEDHILADENEEKIDNPEEIVGESNWERMTVTVANTIYIHNDHMGKNYEVVIAHGMSYSRNVLGEDE